MNPDPIRFSTNPPDNRPPDGFVELNWDAEAGGLVVTDAEGNKSPAGSANGVLEVDYLKTSDQTGFTIPDFAFSRKGNVPYFGNSPIGDGTIIARGTGTLTSTGSPARLLMCSVPVPAEFMTVGTTLHLSVEFSAQVSAPNAGAWGLMFALADATDPLDGVLVQFGDNSGTNIRIGSYLEIVSGLLLTGASANGVIIGSEPTDTAASALHGKAIFGGDGILDNVTEPSTSSVANVLSIYLIDISATIGQSAGGGVKISVSFENP